MASIEGAISDVTLVTKPDPTNEGSTIQVATFNFETISPADIWEVKLTAEQVKDGLHEKLKALGSDPKNPWSKRPVLLNLRSKKTSFQGNNYFSWFVESIPAESKA